MLCINSTGKPKNLFRTPTYTIGGSDSLLTRQGGFFYENEAVFMARKLLWRNINNCIIESRWKIILKINSFSPSKVLLKS